MANATMSFDEYVKIAQVGDVFNIIDWDIKNRTITNIENGTIYYWYIDNCGDRSTNNINAGEMEGREIEIIKSKNKIMSNLTEKFAMMLTKEPQKSFRKTGITDGDNLLTSEGQTIFLAWLLNEKFADEFKTEVVDGILKEMKEEK